MIHLIRLRQLLVLFFFVISHLTFAQIEVVHIPKAKRIKKSTPALQQRVHTDEPLQLPFWDDFSTSKAFPNDTMWLGSQNVHISPTLGIDPPTINVAVFDGANANGEVYSLNNFKVGLADTLLSRPIDLSAIDDPLKNTVYISFYWQLQGQGEKPDSEDSLHLQFRNFEGDWETVWSKSGVGQLNNENFVQEIIQVDPDKYFYENFQFKFESFGRLSGAFDTWSIDYVYLNKGRDSNNTSYLDHALTSVPSSIFEKYTAIPSSQFFSDNFDRSQVMSPVNVNFFNLDKELQPINYFSSVTDTTTNTVLDTPESNTVLNPVPKAFEKRTIISNKVDETKIPEKDSLLLEFKFFINSGDTLLIEKIVGNDTTYAKDYDLRANDTVRSYFPINTYFAYDDGTAEFGAGINQTGGKLAVRYVLSEQDTLTHLDMYFPDLGKNFSGTPIQIFVWSELDNSDNSVLYEAPSSVKRSPAINTFTSYELFPPIIVRDTIYVGFEQAINDQLPVGLDKNTSSSDQVFFNVTGNWESAAEIEGSFMIRPRFDRGAIVTGINDHIGKKDAPIVIYPNPSSGIFQVKGGFKLISLYNNQGKKLNLRTISLNNSSKIDLTEYPNGIYIAYFQKNKIVIPQRVIKR